MTDGSSISLLPLIPSALATVGGLVSRHFSDPRNGYRGKISDIQEDRVGNVTDSLGPIVSDAYLFMRNGDDSEPKQLERHDRASVAVTNSIDQSEDLTPVREALEDFFYPSKAFKRCRFAYDFTGYSLLVGFVSGLILPVSSYLEAGDSVPELVLFISTAVAVISVFVGFLAFVVHRYYARQLDDMSEDSEFTTGS